MNKIILVIISILMHCSSTVRAQDTLTFSGYLATNGHCFQILPGENYPKGPEGNIERIAMLDTITNLKGMGSFLVKCIPKKLTKLQFDYYAPQERNNVDSGTKDYDLNQETFFSIRKKATIRRYYPKHENRKFVILFSYVKVKLDYVVFNSKELKIVTENGIEYKHCDLIRIIRIY